MPRSRTGGGDLRGEVQASQWVARCQLAGRRLGCLPRALGLLTAE